MGAGSKAERHSTKTEKWLRPQRASSTLEKIKVAALIGLEHMVLK
jgi:hypothetical protein